MHQERHLEGRTINHLSGARTDQKGSIIQINVNSWAREPYVKTLAEGLQSKPLPDAIEDATKAFEDVCVRLFEVFGSAGKA